MNQEKKNSIKWIATLMAIIVLFAGVGAALGLVIQQMKQNNTDTPIASGDGKDMFEGQIYEMPSVLAFSADATTASDSGHTASVTQIGRASVGKECVRRCRSRWSPYH